MSPEFSEDEQIEFNNQKFENCSIDLLNTLNDNINNLNKIIECKEEFEEIKSNYSNNIEKGEKLEVSKRLIKKAEDALNKKDEQIESLKKVINFNILGLIKQGIKFPEKIMNDYNIQEIGKKLEKKNKK